MSVNLNGVHCVGGVAQWLKRPVVKTRVRLPTLVQRVKPISGVNCSDIAEILINAA